MNTTTDGKLIFKKDLEKAIAYLGAVEVGPGSDPHEAFTRYAMQGPSGRWHTFSKATLESFAAGALNHFRYQVTIGRAFVLMPSWWSPERRFAWRMYRTDYIDSNYSIGRVRTVSLGTKTDFERDVRPLLERGAHADRITADLETGSEVPA